MTTEIPLYDAQGAVIYIVCVIIWYAIGFGLILIGDIRPRTDRIQRHRCTNVSQAVNDLHEQKARHDILVELKDKNRRQKLWDIYYDDERKTSLMIEKDNETVHSIVKQLDELHEQRRLLRNALYGMSIDQSDDSESNDSIQ
jgi:hypothetical protein